MGLRGGFTASRRADLGIDPLLPYFSSGFTSSECLTMATTSKRSIRIQGLSLSDYNSICARWRAVTENGSNSSWSPRGAASKQGSLALNFQSSLAIRDGHNTATVTFDNEKAKEVGRGAMLETGLDFRQWRIDDVFHGLTILHSPEPAEDPEIEYTSCLFWENQANKQLNVALLQFTASMGMHSTLGLPKMVRRARCGFETFCHLHIPSDEPAL